MMLSVPVDLAAGQTKHLEVHNNTESDKPLPSMLRKGEPTRIETDAFTVLVDGARVELRDGNAQVAAVIEPFGPNPGRQAVGHLA